MKTRSLLLTQEQVGSLREFLTGIPTVQVIALDDPPEGLRGYVCFVQKEGMDEENTLLFQHRYAKPASITERLPILNDILEPVPDGSTDLRDAFLDMVRACISQPGWRKCDDPKRRLIGFIKQVPVDSHEDSQVLMIPFGVFKAIPDNLKQDVMSWRASNDDEVTESLSVACDDCLRVADSSKWCHGSLSRKVYNSV